MVREREPCCPSGAEDGVGSIEDVMRIEVHTMGTQQREKFLLETSLPVMIDLILNVRLYVRLGGLADGEGRVSLLPREFSERWEGLMYPQRRP